MVALCCRQSADGFLFFPQVRNKPGAMVLCTDTNALRNYEYDSQFDTHLSCFSAELTQSGVYSSESFIKLLLHVVTSQK